MPSPKVVNKITKLTLKKNNKMRITVYVLYFPRASDGQIIVSVCANT